MAKKKSKDETKHILRESDTRKAKAVFVAGCGRRVYDRDKFARSLDGVTCAKCRKSKAFKTQQEHADKKGQGRVGKGENRHG